MFGTCACGPLQAQTLLSSRGAATFAWIGVLQRKMQVEDAANRGMLADTAPGAS